MATHRAIEAVSQTIVELLRDEYDPSDFSQDLEFRVVGTDRLSVGIDAGVSLFLYRIFVNGVMRSPEGRLDEEGHRLLPELPLDIHFILTAWGRDPSLQHAIAGWMMRVVEDHTQLPAALLNRRTPGIFRSDEAVELSVAEMATEDLFRLWEMVGVGAYHLSVPYLARSVRIESRRAFDTFDPVQFRGQDQHLIGGGA